MIIFDWSDHLAFWFVLRAKNAILPDLVEEVRECWFFQASNATGLICSVASEGNSQGPLDVSRAIGKAPSVAEVCVGINQRAAGLCRRSAATH